MIDSFRGKYNFLSNFYPAPVCFNDIEYPTVENAYQAQKTTKQEIRENFIDLTAIKAREVGRKLKLRKDWSDELKLGIMYKLVKQKFEKHNELKMKLLATGETELIEGNHWNDIFWGVCRGEGENHLGKILMKVREELK